MTTKSNTSTEIKISSHSMTIMDSTTRDRIIRVISLKCSNTTRTTHMTNTADNQMISQPMATQWTRASFSQTQGRISSSSISHDIHLRSNLEILDSIHQGITRTAEIITKINTIRIRWNSVEMVTSNSNITQCGKTKTNTNTTICSQMMIRWQIRTSLICMSSNGLSNNNLVKMLFRWVCQLNSIHFNQLKGINQRCRLRCKMLK